MIKRNVTVAFQEVVGLLYIHPRLFKYCAFFFPNVAAQIFLELRFGVPDHTDYHLSIPFHFLFIFSVTCDSSFTFLLVTTVSNVSG
jgi:hypothetical protein